MEKPQLLNLLKKVKNKEIHYSDAENMMRSDLTENIDQSIPARGENTKMAIIGMACRLPGADSVEALWVNLINGVDSVSEVPNQRWKLDDFYSPDANKENKSYSKWGGFISGIGEFDADFFNLSKEDILSIDPQHLIALQLAWEVFETAGYGNIKELGKDVGVFWGARGSSYTVANLGSKTPQSTSVLNRNYILGRAQNMIAARISDFLNLKGPAVVLDTACSSSLVGVHFACQSLKNGDCEMALVGGVDLLLDSDSYVGLSKAKAISLDGKCFTFDRRANGYVPGEGAGAIVLKPYEQAVQDGDTIYGTIIGSAINNDGHTMGITTPDLEGQKSVIRKALNNARIDPSTVSYVEAHGTGTTIGDPIEVKALTECYRDYTERKGYCGIGSIKTNIGHLHCAAGIAGLIKLALTLYNKKIPPTLNCIFPNPRFDFANSPFYPVIKLEDWNPVSGIRRGAISSLGFGGTNCHLIMEEHRKESLTFIEDNQPELFVLSARSEYDLKNVAANYISYLENNDNISITDLCHTVKTGRQKFAYRLSTITENTADLLTKLKKYYEGKSDLEDDIYTGHKSRKISNKVVFMFTGQGALYTGAAKDVYETWPVFRKTLDYCSDILFKYLSKPITEYLFSPSLHKELRETSITQPLTFALDYSLACLLISWGIKPRVVFGHSLGEYVAACIAGVFSLEDALILVAERGRLMQQLPRNGSMVAVIANVKKVTELIERLAVDDQERIAIASDNSGSNVVISGEKKALDQFIKITAEEGIKTIPLSVSHAFHSPLMRPMLEEFRKVVGGIKAQKPTIPLLSNVTGQLITQEAVDPEYWVEHIVKPVQFRKSINKVVSDGYHLFVEVGPGNTLANMASQAVTSQNKILISPLLKRNSKDQKQILQVLARLFAKGVNIDFNAIENRDGLKRIPLPTYSFNNEQYIEWHNMSQEDSSDCWDSHLIDGWHVKENNRNYYYKVFNVGEEKLFNEHRVNGRSVLPAVCCWEMAFASAFTYLNQKGIILKEVTHKLPITTGRLAARIVRIVLEEKQELHFKIETFDQEANLWLENTVGIIERSGQGQVPNLPVDQIKLSLNEASVQAEELYHSFSKRGLDYGAFFRSVSQVWHNDREALALVNIPEQFEDIKENYISHPALLDGAMQAISVLLNKETADLTYMPFYIEQVILKDKVIGSCYSYARLTKVSSNNEIVKADVDIIDTTGKELAKIIGFTMKKIERSQNLNIENDQTDQIDNWFYQVKWMKELGKLKVNKMKSNSYLIFAEEGELSHSQVIERIQDEGCQVIPVYPGTHCMPRDKGGYYVNPSEKDSYKQLWHEVEGDFGQVDGVIHLWRYNDKLKSMKNTTTLQESQIKGVYSLLYITQTLISRKSFHVKRFLVVTSNSQPVEKNAKVYSPENAPMLGFLFTLSKEIGNIECTYVDMDTVYNPGRNGEFILNELKMSPELFVAYYNEQRYVRKVVKFDNNVSKQGQTVEFRDQGTYLITGGLGGIGLKVAEYIARKSKSNIILTGRSGFPESQEKIKQIKKIESLGARIDIYKADVTDLDQMKECVQEIKARFGGINGIIHAAGVLSDGLIANMDINKFKKVLLPKMLGAQVLHKITEDDEMDFMLLFSGLVSYVGIVGQSNHTAANCFEDSFAFYRNNLLNQPTMVINWGIWGGTGVVANPFYRKQLKEQGFIPMETEEAMAAFERALRLGQVQLGIGNIAPHKAKQLLDTTSFQKTVLGGNSDPFFKLIAEVEEVKPDLFKDVNYTIDIDFTNKLELLSVTYVLEYFRKYGIFVDIESKVQLPIILKKCQVLSKYEKQVGCMLQMLKDIRIIAGDERGYYLTKEPDLPLVENQVQVLSEEFPQADVFVRILRHCMNYYPEVLSGELNAMHVLFPEGSSKMLEELYHQPSPYNQMLSVVVAEYIKKLDLDRPIRILEIGGGTGGTTAKLLPQIEKFAVEYCFTDISHVLLKQSEERFKRYPFIEYKKLNIETKPAAQGFNERRFDLVIAANVLHATEDLGRTFKNVMGLMAPDSLLVMMETTMTTPFADLVFGLTDGWWSFEDKKYRKQSVLMEAKDWEKALTSFGFTRVKALPVNNTQTARYPYSVIMAQPSPGKIQEIENEKTIAESRDVKPETPVRAVIPKAEQVYGDITEEIRDFLLDKIASLMPSSPDCIDSEAGFLEIGLESLALVSLAGTIEKELEVKLYPTLFFEYQSIDDLTAFFAENYQSEFKKYRERKQNMISISMEKREDFQGEEELEQENVSQDIQHGSELRVKQQEHFVEKEHLVEDVKDIAIIGMAGMFPEAGGLDQFWDNLIQGIDCVSEIGPERWNNTSGDISGSKGFCKWGGIITDIDQFDAHFFNISPKEAKRMDPQQRLFMETALSCLENGGYGGKRLYNSRTGVFVGVSNHNYHSIAFDPTDNFSTLGTSNAMVANRLSYFMNFNGPSLSIDTQCSSSLVALNYAYQSLFTGECQTAIAGGVNLIIPESYYQLLSHVGALSPDGRCKTFDRSANGFVSGEGVTALLLKPLGKALKDGDHIHAVIKGISVNHDGRSNNVSAPNTNAQMMVITNALEKAGVDPETISYIEAHGTGTSLGDPVEISALKHSFEKYTDKKAFCAIGSVKTNIGHLESSAGIAGVIKVILAMKQRKLPKNLHFNMPNSYLDFNNSPFYVVDRTTEWVSDFPLRAGVSSFGMGGTNAHVVLEEAPKIYHTQSIYAEKPSNLAVLSAKTPKSLRDMVDKLQSYLEKKNYSLTDICYTLNYGRGHYNQRLALVCDSVEMLKQKLCQAKNMLANNSIGMNDMVYFNSLVSNSREAKNQNSIFICNDLKDGIGIISQLRGVKLVDQLLEDTAVRLGLNSGNQLLDLAQTADVSAGYNKIINLLGEYLLFRIMMNWGIKPTVVLGLGSDLFAAAAVSGLLSIETSLLLAAKKEGIYDEPVELIYKDAVDQIPLYGLINGNLEKITIIPEYFQRKMDSTAELAEKIYEMISKKDCKYVLEIGDESSLIGKLVSFTESKGKEISIISLISKGKDIWHLLMKTIARIYVNGGKLNWQGFFTDQSPKVVELPSYSFDKKQFWVKQEFRKKQTVGVFGSYSYNGFTFNNRIVKSGIEVAAALPGGEITEKYLDYYREWSNSGAGINIVGNLMVSEDGCESEKEVVILDKPSRINELSKLVQIAKSSEVILIGQLNHAGLLAKKAMDDLSDKKLKQIAIHYLNAARIVKKAGFDGIQLHATNGFLLSQLLSPKYDFVNRDSIVSNEKGIRFISDLIGDIKNEVGHGFLVLVKIDRPEAEKGLRIDEWIRIVKRFEESGLDMLEISRGVSPKAQVVEMEQHNQFIKEVGRIKEAVKIPVIATGGFRKLEQIRQAIESNAVDFVGLGRPFICEPHLVDTMLKDNKTSACQSCNLCIMSLAENGLRCAKRMKLRHSTQTGMLFERVWEPTESCSSAKKCDIWIVFDPLKIADECLNTFIKVNHYEIILVCDGKYFNKVNNNLYKINYSNYEDYEQLISKLSRDYHGRDLGFIHLGGFGRGEQGLINTNSLERCLTKGVNSLLLLSKAIAAKDSFSQVKLITVTRSAQKVNGEEELFAENSMVIGLTRIIPYELKNIQAKTIDLDQSEGKLGEILLKELGFGNRRVEELAYRAGKRYDRKVIPVSCSTRRKKVPLTRDGVYLITGGTSGLGALFARHLVSKGVQNIVLTGRKSLPPENEWELLLTSGDLDDHVRQVINLILELRALGSQISYIGADVNQRDEMQKVTTYIRKNLDQIKGVIHCAGLLDSVKRTLRTKNLESFKRVLMPKVFGTINLLEAVVEDQPDFILFCSSIAALKGKLGAALSDYAVANTFLDHLAESLNRKFDTRLISVNWSLWDGVGHGSRKAQGDLTFTLSPEEGLKAFDEIIEDAYSGNIAVMNTKVPGFSLQYLAEDEVKSEAVREIAVADEKVIAKSVNPPGVSNEKVEDFIIQLLVQLLQLEKDDINKNEDFYEYGIDSVIITDMVGAIEKEYNIYTHPTIILENPTVKLLAEYLVKTFDLSENNEPEPVDEKDQGESQENQLGQEQIPSIDQVGDTGLLNLLERLSDGQLTYAEAIKKYGGLS